MILLILFIVLFCSVVGGILKLAIKASWGLVKFLSSVVLTPLVILCLALVGFMKIAIVLLVIMGILTLLGFKK